MKTLTEKPKDVSTQRRRVISQQKTNREKVSFADRRADASVFETMQQMADSSPQAKQLGVLQRMATSDFNADNSNVIQAIGWESIGWLNPRRYLPVTLGGYTKSQMVENGLAPTAEERIGRWVKRGEKRKETKRLDPGRYQTPTGPFTLSNLWGQRMTQSRKDDYDGETFGSVPPYSKLKKLPKESFPPLLGGQTDESLPAKDRLATTLASGLVHGSEEDREPGAGKFIRSLIRWFINGRESIHPFDNSVNPSVDRGGAEKMRNLLGDPKN